MRANGSALRLAQMNGAEQVPVGFFQRALGLDGAILDQRDIATDPVSFMDQFMKWVARPTQNTRLALKVKVGGDGYVHLPAQGKSIPVATDALKGGYKNRTVVMVPYFFRGQITFEVEMRLASLRK